MKKKLAKLAQLEQACVFERLFKDAEKTLAERAAAISATPNAMKVTGKDISHHFKREGIKKKKILNTNANPNGTDDLK